MKIFERLSATYCPICVDFLKQSYALIDGSGSIVPARCQVYLFHLKTDRYETYMLYKKITL